MISWIIRKLGLDGLFGWLHVAICALTTEDGRKGWAMLAALGCSFVMTGYALVALYLVRDKAGYVFWLGMTAHGIILIVVTGLMVLLGIKRKINVEGDKDGAKLNIEDTGT